MYYWTSTDDLYHSRKHRKLDLYTMYNYYKGRWTKVGIYKKAQIDGALEEGTLVEISRRRANTLIHEGAVKC